MLAYMSAATAVDVVDARYIWPSSVAVAEKQHPTDPSAARETRSAASQLDDRLAADLRRLEHLASETWGKLGTMTVRCVVVTFDQG